MAGGLKKLGKAGETIAWIVALIETKLTWGAVMSLGFGILAALWLWLFEFFSNAHTQIAIGVFLASLWTYIGVHVLRRSIPDYRYGLTFEGLVVSYQPDMEKAALAFGIQFRNFTMAPVAYTVDTFDVRIGTRTLPKLKSGTLKASFIPRGGTRMSNNNPFSKKDIEEFLGKTVSGTVEFSVSYGAPKKPPVRTLKMVLKMDLVFRDDGSIGFGSGIEEESDEPFSAS